MFSGVKARFSALRRILLSGISRFLELLPRLVTREHLHHVERVLLRHQISAKWDQIHRLEGLRERPSLLLCELAKQQRGSLSQSFESVYLVPLGGNLVAQ